MGKIKDSLIDPWYCTVTGKNDELNYISIALTGKCNLKCEFCYVGGSREGLIELNFLYKMINESLPLGLKRVQLTGGEPLLYENIKEIIKFLNEKNIEILLVTNGTLVTKDMAGFLYDNNVIVGISMESIEESVDDALTGVPGTLKKKLVSIENLISVGYTKDRTLNIIMKTLRQNYPSYIKTWKWATEKGIQPILDRAIPTKSCKIDWIISGEQLKGLMKEIGRLQGEESDIPFIGCEPCNRLKNGFHVEINGDVYPCAGIELLAGNLHESSVKEIWENSEVIQKCKHINENLKGSCKVCVHKRYCYGCRAVAYAVFKDLYAPDPFCWNYKK